MLDSRPPEQSSNPTWAKLVHTVGWVEGGEGLAEVVGYGVGGPRLPKPVTSIGVSLAAERIWSLSCSREGCTVRVNASHEIALFRVARRYRDWLQ